MNLNPDELWNPMLAAEGELGKIKYPKIALPKLNGVRGCNQKGLLLSRSKKPIPNLYTRKLFSIQELTNFEGELVVGDFAHEEVFSISTSGVMSKDGTPDVVWHLFDMFHPTLPFYRRLEDLYDMVKDSSIERIAAVESKVMNSDAELQAYADWALTQGYEGLVLRDPMAKYKNGRSTQGEGGFMRFCPWFRSEATILSIVEGQVNQNESVRNELGYLKKSSHKENMVGSGQAGSVRVRDLVTGIEFNMPVPTDKLQKEMWADKAKYLNAIVKYKFKPSVIVGGKPRFPIYEGIRHSDDM
jgi:DNA ligase-1